MELTLKSGALIVKAVTRKRHSLSDLLKHVTPSNRHASVATGNVVGSEVW